MHPEMVDIKAVSVARLSGCISYICQVHIFRLHIAMLYQRKEPSEQNEEHLAWTYTEKECVSKRLLSPFRLPQVLYYIM